jgi:hypothetical protein
MRASRFSLALALLLLPCLHAAVPAEEAAPRIAASRVTLDGELKLSAALKKLADTGNRIVDLRPRLGQEVTDPTLTLVLRDAPFWEALDLVAELAHLQVTPHLDAKTGASVIGIQAQAEGATSYLPTAYSSPFRIVVKQVAATRNLARPAESTLTYQVQLTCEPRLQPILLKIGRQSVAASVGGEALKPVDQGGVGVVRLIGEASTELTIRLPLPPRGTAQFKLLRGEYQALVPPEQLTFELPQLAVGARAEQQGVEATVTSFQNDRAAQRWLIGMKLNYPPGTFDLESHQTWALERTQLELRHKQTKTVVRTNLSPEIGIDEGRSFHITYAFAAVPGRPEEWEIIYRTPAPPVLYPVRFEFKDLPLP